jgi:hypothetical protein
MKIVKSRAREEIRDRKAYIGGVVGHKRCQGWGPIEHQHPGGVWVIPCNLATGWKG